MLGWNVAELIAVSSRFSMYRLAKMGESGDPMTVPSTCSIKSLGTRKGSPQAKFTSSTSSGAGVLYSSLSQDLVAGKFLSYHSKSLIDGHLSEEVLHIKTDHVVLRCCLYLS